ncbi:FAD binding domain protein [Xylona heveae TC161]|uniref:FAD binding domain protein n=1 Tax=Xylona heveae (strain CBS 132557 / TC161) TaxID=1328760 RepID=A0A165J8Y3_XYLHT|nr:FAD binding domain protein [Xylona heveae TC161]KZF25911.1 FAD binding domain protein [Xylona heveae TC161]
MIVDDKPATEICQPIVDSRIKELRSCLKSSNLVTPGCSAYGNSIQRWAKSSEKRAGCIVYAESAEDVSATVLFARKHNLDLAVKGGGHSTSGSSSTEGGIVIDLSRMSQVQVFPESKQIAIQGGALWADVDRVAGEYGLATVGGTVNHTGVGGLTLGGGYGWLSGMYGLVIDNLVKANIVLADGRIMSASADENPDLFWAVRGAGQNFGIVVEFTLQAYDQPNPVWAGLLGFAPDKLEAIIEFTNHLSTVNQGNSGLLVVLATPPGMVMPIVMTAIYYNGSTEEGTRQFAPLLALGPILNTVAEIPYHQLNGILSEAGKPGDRVSTKGPVFHAPISPHFVRGIYNDLAQYIHEQPDATATAIFFEFHAPSKICEVAQTATSFAGRDKHNNAMILGKWSQPENDKTCRDWVRKMARKITDETTKLNRGQNEIPKEYVNYDSLGAKAEDVYGANYDRLRQLKSAYDPQNVFNKSHPIVPAPVS